VTAPAAAVGRWQAQARLADRTNRDLADLWAAVEWRELLGSWSTVAPGAFVTVSAAQLEAASGADAYVDTVLDQLGIDGGAPAGRVQPMSFAGIASDGRSLDGLLIQPVLQVLDLAAAGAGQTVAMRHGLYVLQMIGQTQVADAGRVAVGAATAARRKVSGYVRHLVPPSCSRCAVLAGKYYRWNRGFQRHPHCNCIHIPVSEDVAGDVRTTPQSYFDSLPAADQDRFFGKAGAQAIRDGADITQVVNARRGMYAASVGGRTVAATREGVTIRGLYGATAVNAQLGGLRLMPEQIYRDANGDRALAISLLQRFGYLTTN
jgi:hypothetical protein